MIYEEPLPDSCPPDDAADQAWDKVHRLIDSAAPGPDTFKSQAALGLSVPHGVPECRWASCSLVFDPIKQKKLPKFRDTHNWAAVLHIPKGAGASKRKGNHVDFWQAQGFSMTDAIVEVIAI